MKQTIKYDVPLVPKRRQLRVIMWGARLIGLMMALSTVLSVFAVLCVIPNLLHFERSIECCQYITYMLFNIMLSLEIAWTFNRFIWGISEYIEIFSRKQSERLISLAFLHLCMFVIRLLAPTLSALESPMPWFQPMEVYPEIDLQLLMFAAMFFALAGVFEYGRMLKKDSDSIV